MDADVEHTLEFEKVRGILARYAATTMGKR